MTAITNRRLFTLSVLTAALPPPALVAGFLGMGTKDMPFQTIDDGTWYAVAICAGASLVTDKTLRRLQAF